MKLYSPHVEPAFKDELIEQLRYELSQATAIVHSKHYNTGPCDYVKLNTVLLAGARNDRILQERPEYWHLTGSPAPASAATAASAQSQNGAAA
jgi:hypothetical protein